MSTLTIISHTEHYKNSEGKIVGLGSTVTEINHLTTIFDKIIHVAMLHDTLPPASSLPYTSESIKFVPIQALGGLKLSDKLSIFLKAPSVLRTVHKAISKTDYFQFRAPTGIGVFVIPYLVLFSSKRGWFKYAGNWKQRDSPIAYSFQRWLLKNQKRVVTINGTWQDQPLHCISFENPCLTYEEIRKGKEIIHHKKLDSNGLSICFVGRLEKEKGLDLLIDALLSLNTEEISKIRAIQIVGQSNNLEYYLERTKNSGLNFIFHGFLSRSSVHDIYIKCHAIILPSASEGFPKVISEAMNYGCLPLVSDISSIKNYVKDDVNGFLFYPVTLENLIFQIRKLINLSNSNFCKMTETQNQNLFRFTYTYYNKRILEDVLDRY